MAFDTVRTQQDALGADRARRRHRHHVDRRHDGAHPRLRQSLRDMIRAIGPNTIFVQRFGVTSFANGAEITRAAQAAEPDDLRRARARGTEPTRSSSSTSSSAPAARRRSSACSIAHQKTKPLRRLRHAARYFAEGTRIPIARRPLLQRHRGAVPEERRRARQHGRTSCCSSRAASIRSARPSASAASGSRWSACSTSGRRPAASTSARTTSSSSRTRPISASSG